MKSLQAASTLLILFAACHHHVEALRHQAHFVRPVSSRRPWVTHQPGSYATSYRRNAQSHYLSYEEAKNDSRSRKWTGSLFAQRRNNGQRLSWISKLIFLNVVAYAAQAYWPQFTNWGVKRSDLILKGQQLYRLVTPIFLHGGLGHLMTNMYSLRNVGPSVESLFGPSRFLFTYMAAGVAGNVCSAFQSPNPALGASGAVFGVLGAFTVFLMRHDWLLGQTGEQMSSRLMQTAVLNIGLGFVNPSIDNWGHIGGFAGGMMMAYWFGPRLYVTDEPTSGERMLIDRPVARLPRSLERIPKKMGSLAGRITRRFRVDRHLQEARPWQEQRRPKGRPTRSVRPDR